MAMTETVVVYFSPLNEPMYEHERVTLHAVARRIAELKRCGFGGLFRADGRYPGDVFFVPDETLVLEEAIRLGIRRPTDLFGGVVPHSFVGTKAITHSLIDENADRPPGWCARFASRVEEIVLPGYTAFSARDARTAATRLLRMGPVQIKNAFSAGGGGQRRAKDLTELDASSNDFRGTSLRRMGSFSSPAWTKSSRGVSARSPFATDSSPIMACRGQRRTTRENRFTAAPIWCAYREAGKCSIACR